MSTLRRSWYFRGLPDNSLLVRSCNGTLRMSALSRARIILLFSSAVIILPILRTPSYKPAIRVQ